MKTLIFGKVEYFPLDNTHWPGLAGSFLTRMDPYDGAGQNAVLAKVMPFFQTTF